MGKARDSIDTIIDPSYAPVVLIVSSSRSYGKRNPPLSLPPFTTDMCVDIFHLLAFVSAPGSWIEIAYHWRLIGWPMSFNRGAVVTTMPDFFRFGTPETTSSMGGTFFRTARFAIARKDNIKHVVSTCGLRCYYHISSFLYFSCARLRKFSTHWRFEKESLGESLFKSSYSWLQSC